jgi:hypothetical protein
LCFYYRQDIKKFFPYCAGSETPEGGLWGFLGFWFY